MKFTDLPLTAAQERHLAELLNDSLTPRERLVTEALQIGIEATLAAASNTLVVGADSVQMDTPPED